MKIVLRLSVAMAGMALITACGADPTAALHSVDRLVVSHDTRLVTVNRQISLQVAAYDLGNRLVQSPVLRWTSSDSSIATVDRNGLVTGHRVGQVRIRASSSGVEGSIFVAVRAPKLRISLKSGSAILTVGEKVSLTAEFLDAAGDLMPTDAPIRWSTADPDVVKIEHALGQSTWEIMVTALGIGFAQVSAIADGVEGKYVIGIPSQRLSDSPIQADFQFLQYSGFDRYIAVIPAVRLSVAPGRIVELTKIEVGLPGFTPDFPPLCAGVRLFTGLHEVLGVESYPPEVDLSTRSTTPLTNSRGVAMVTYRAENGALHSIAFEGMVTEWDYDYAFNNPVSWALCKSEPQSRTR